VTNWSWSIPLLVDCNVIACAECIAGWWYGVVGHLEPCDGNENHCHCHDSGEKLILDSVVVMKFSFSEFVYRGYMWDFSCYQVNNIFVGRDDLPRSRVCRAHFLLRFGCVQHLQHEPCVHICLTPVWRLKILHVSHTTCFTEVIKKRVHVIASCNRPILNLWLSWLNYHVVYLNQVHVIWCWYKLQYIFVHKTIYAFLLFNIVPLKNGGEDGGI
jgi:hypothetical protein